MKTAAWSQYTGPGRISICLGRPWRAPPGFRVYRPLNPTWPMLKLPHEQYVPLYEAILAGLDPARVWDDLHQLAGDAEPHLMCFERWPLAEGEHCHRHQAAKWLERELGVEVPELVGDVQLRLL